MCDDASVALLASIFEDSGIDQLIDVLKSVNGDVTLAVEQLMKKPTSTKRSRPSSLYSATPQSSGSNGLSDVKRTKVMRIDSWLRHPKDLDQSSSERGSRDYVDHPATGVGATGSSTNQQVLRSLNDVLGKSSDGRVKQTSKESKNAPYLPPLLLATPKEVSAHLPCCSLLYNILPAELANGLYLSMLADCEGQAEDKKPWARNRWWLNDREVESPHSTAFFISNSQGETDDCSADYSESAQYWYAGKPLQADAKPRYFLSEMEEAKRVIEPIVNQILRNDPIILERAHRIADLNPVQRFSDEWHGDWRANVAASNCYRGSKESVGWHADQLTYLGPYPTIASLSLGTGRKFCLRAVRNPNDPSAPTPRTYSIFLPHNSLLIMHGSCQERYKHCIPTQNTLDAFKLSSSTKSHIERINITFRFYRPDFRPTRTSGDVSAASHNMGTPKCHCGVPTILRADQKGKVPTKLTGTSSVTESSDGQLIATKKSEEKSKLQFFWQCQGGQQNEGKGCRFFRLLDMEKEHRGPCLGSEEAAKLSNLSGGSSAV